jgi:hypothetical protein
MGQKSRPGKPALDQAAGRRRLHDCADIGSTPTSSSDLALTFLARSASPLHSSAFNTYTSTMLAAY